VQVIRDGMARASVCVRKRPIPLESPMRLIPRLWGVDQADVAIKDGKIAAFGSRESGYSAWVDIIIRPGHRG